MDNLTDRQRDIYRYIRNQMAFHGHAPTYREIGVEFGIKSPNGVMCHLTALEKKGFLYLGNRISLTNSALSGYTYRCQDTGGVVVIVSDSKEEAALAGMDSCEGVWSSYELESVVPICRSVTVYSDRSV